jgi:hypothetical protein
MAITFDCNQNLVPRKGTESIKEILHLFNGLIEKYVPPALITELFLFCGVCPGQNKKRSILSFLLAL